MKRVSTSNGMSRREFLAGAVAAVAGLGLAACGSRVQAPAATSPAASSASSATTQAATGATQVRVASLKGPTSIGLVELMDQAKAGNLANQYEFSISGTPDEVTPKVISGDVDVALVPANVASVLYNKTKGAVEVIDVNTLGVLHVVTGNQSVASFADIAGKTVYMTGKGATPEYVMTYLVNRAGIEDRVDFEYKSEATEVVSALAADPSAVGVLPEPFKTAAMAKSQALASPVDLNDVWDQYAEGGSRLLTGVTVVRREFADQHPEAVWEFLDAHAKSVDAVNADPAKWSQAVADAGIVDSAQVAEKAIPGCHVVCLRDAELKSALSGFLSVLYQSDNASVGGALPGDDFYYAIQGA